MNRMLLNILLFVNAVIHIRGFYLPGVAPHDYEPNEKVLLKVNKLSSTHTQLPYDYYSLKYCKPEGGVRKDHENLGEFLSGDRIENSPYEVCKNYNHIFAYIIDICFSTVYVNICRLISWKKSIAVCYVSSPYHTGILIDSNMQLMLSTTTTGLLTIYLLRQFLIVFYL